MCAEDKGTVRDQKFVQDTEQENSWWPNIGIPGSEEYMLCVKVSGPEQAERVPWTEYPKILPDPQSCSMQTYGMEQGTLVMEGSKDTILPMYIHTQATSPKRLLPQSMCSGSLQFILWL